MGNRTCFAHIFIEFYKDHFSPKFMYKICLTRLNRLMIWIGKAKLESNKKRKEIRQPVFGKSYGSSAHLQTQ